MNKVVFSNALQWHKENGITYGHIAPCLGIMKLTENEVIQHLINYLENEEWQIESYCLGQKRGNDIVATKDGETLVVEAKGARADDKSPTKRRDKFSGGQIKKHFGYALIKIMGEKYKNPSFNYAIAQPNDDDILKHTANLIPFLKKLDIGHYWVSADGSIRFE
jgi:hypothetical protein